MKKYSTPEKERKVFAVVMLIVLLLMLAGMIMTVCGVFDEPEWKPAAEYPLVNQKISWNSCLSL